MIFQKNNSTINWLNLSAVEGDYHYYESFIAESLFLTFSNTGFGFLLEAVALENLQ